MTSSETNAVPERSDCPIARTLDLLGDRWTLIVVRDMLKFDKRRYGEFQASPEGIPTNVLADRLKRLERSGLVCRRLYHEHPPRWEYHPTWKARDLEPALDALFAWGAMHLGASGDPHV
ncbi:MAG: winged helix-turn-helix transcriptional regulator [Candidatus Bipolaricaulia bacterium]